MAEQRSRDEIVLKGETSVEELDNSGGPEVEEVYFQSFDVPIFNKVGEEKESQDFGRDTNRLDYFRVTAFNVLGDDDDLTTITDYGGGGGGGDRTREVVAGPLLEQYRTTANGGGERTKVEQDRGRIGGGDTSRQIPMRDVANGGEMVVESGGKKRIGGAGRGLRWWDKWCYCCHCG